MHAIPPGHEKEEDGEVEGGRGVESAWIAEGMEVEDNVMVDGEMEGQRDGGGGESHRRTKVQKRHVARALYLVRSMAHAGMRSRRESIALAQQVCANSGSIEGALEIRRLESSPQDRRAHDFLGQWRRRSERPRASAKTHRGAGGR